MLNTKKILAAALAATMVFGSSISVFADDPVTSGGSDGAGASEGHVDKEVVNVVLPVIPTGSTPFAYTMDPERLIQATDAAKYAEGTTFPKAAGDTGVYFLTGENTYANASNVVQAINKSSCDVTLTVKVKTTATGDADIALATSSTVATTGTPNLYLGLKVGTETTVVSGTEQTVTKTIAGDPDNFEIAVTTGENDAKSYVYQQKADATTWKAVNISMEGAVSNLPIATTTTAPTVNVTWSYAKAADSATVDTADLVDYSDTPASAAPSISTTSYTMAADTPVTVQYSLGVGDAAAEGIQSVVWSNAYPGANLYDSADYITKDLNAKTFTLTAASINNMIEREGDSQTIKVTFDDGTIVDLTFNDPE